MTTATTFATMTSEEFYTAFDSCLWDEDRIRFLLEAHEANYPFHLEDQPDAMIQRFYRGTKPAMEVAEVFIKCFPAPIICRESTYCARRPVTLLDAFQQDMSQYACSDEFDRIVNLVEAFSRLGIKNAEWCDPHELYNSYMADPIYQRISINQGWCFELIEDSDSEPEEGWNSRFHNELHYFSQEENMYDSDDSDTEGLARIQPLP